MKKLVFLFAMVLFAGFAMAQKTTTIVQSGNSNTATVDQMASMSGDVNSIFATQSGDWNGLTTVQKGWDNNIDLMQSGNHNTADMTQETCDFGENNGYNTAKVVQYGNNNTANLSQEETDGNGADVWVMGIFPVPGTEMDRSINEATATQSGDHNTYNLEQGRDEYIPDNTSYLVQSGNSNTADVDQLGFKNYSEIRQRGDWNNADLFQDGADFINGSMDESYSWQTGAHSTLNVKQVGEVDEQLAESKQNGGNNTTTILQVGFTEQNVNAWQYGTDVIDVDQVDVEP